jgi:hypothetical protein
MNLRFIFAAPDVAQRRARNRKATAAIVEDYATPTRTVEMPVGVDPRCNGTGAGNDQVAFTRRKARVVGQFNVVA